MTEAANRVTSLEAEIDTLQEKRAQENTTGAITTI